MKVVSSNGGIAIGKIVNDENPIEKFKGDNFYEITVMKSTSEKVPGHIVRKRERVTESFIFDIEDLRRMRAAPQIELAGLCLTIEEIDNGKTDK